MWPKNFLLSVFFLTHLSISGCSLLHKPVGATLISYAEIEALPFFLAETDPDLLCLSGTSLLPLLESFKRVEVETSKIGISLFLLSGFCAEQDAHTLDISELLSDKNERYVDAISYASLKKRTLALAAKRQYRSYQNTLLAFSGNPPEKCPSFSDDIDTLQFLLGYLQGLEALLNNGKSGSMANIPLNISNDIYRAMNCVENKKWWGVPTAVQAALLVFLPELNRNDSERIDDILQESIKEGWKSGVPLAETVALAAWEGQGKHKKIETLLQNHYQNNIESNYDQRWLAITRISNRHLDNYSDHQQLSKGNSLTPEQAEPFLIEATPSYDLDLDDL